MEFMPDLHFTGLICVYHIMKEHVFDVAFVGMLESPDKIL